MVATHACHHTTVRDLSKQGKPYEEEFLVDAGAIGSLAPSVAMESLAVAMESLGLVVNPVTRERIPVDAKPLKLVI